MGVHRIARRARFALPSLTFLRYLLISEFPKFRLPTDPNQQYIPCRPVPWLASSLREDAQATVSNKPGHRGEHEVSRKTIARGMPGRSGVTVVTTLVCFFILHARPRRIARPAFPAPSLSRAHSVINSGAIRAARTWNSGRLAGRNISPLAKAAPTGQKNPEKEKTPAERHIEHQGQGLHRRDLRAPNPACARQIHRAAPCRSRQGRD